MELIDPYILVDFGGIARCDHMTGCTTGDIVFVIGSGEPAVSNDWCIGGDKPLLLVFCSKGSKAIVQLAPAKDFERIVELTKATFVLQKGIERDDACECLCYGEGNEQDDENEGCFEELGEEYRGVVSEAESSQRDESEETGPVPVGEGAAEDGSKQKYANQR